MARTAHRTWEVSNIRQGRNVEYPKSKEVIDEVVVKLPNSMKWGPWEPYSSSAPQNFPAFYGTTGSFPRSPKLAMGPWLKNNPPHALLSHFFKIHFNITLPSRLGFQNGLSFKCSVTRLGGSTNHDSSSNNYHVLKNGNARARTHMHAHTHAYIHTYIHTYIHVSLTVSSHSNCVPTGHHELSQSVTVP